MKLNKIFLTLSILAFLGMGCNGGGSNSSSSNDSTHTTKTYGFFRTLQSTKTVISSTILNATTNPSITMATTRSGHKAIAIGGGKFMLIGGEINWTGTQMVDSTDPSVIDIFDSNTEMFTHINTVTNVDRHYNHLNTDFDLCSLPNGNILIFGGSQKIDTLEIFNPNDYSIQLIKNVFQDPINNVEKIFYIGNNRVILINTSYVTYNSQTYKGNAIIDISTMKGTLIDTPINVFGSGIIQMPDLSIVYMGGAESVPGIVHSDIWRIDPNTLITTKIGNLLVPRMWFGVCYLSDNKIGIYGGVTFSPDVVRYKSVEILDPATWISTSSIDLLGYRALMSSVQLQNGFVLNAGGTDENGGIAKSEFVHNNILGISGTTGDLNTPRIFYSVIPLNNGRLLISGGITYQDGVDKATDTAEIYDPALKLIISYDTTTTIFASVAADNTTTPITPENLSIIHFSSSENNITWKCEALDPSNDPGIIDSNGVFTAPYTPSIIKVTGTDKNNISASVIITVI